MGRQGGEYMSSKYIRKEFGATLVEYSLLVGLIALVALASINFMGSKMSTQFSDIQNKLNDAM